MSQAIEKRRTLRPWMQAALFISPVLLGVHALADAPSTAESQASDDHPPFWKWDSATADLAGLRPELGARGCTLDATFAADLSKNLRGGVNTEGYNFGHLLNVSLTLDTEKLHLWKGGEFFLNFQNENGQFLQDDTGDLQGADNLAADGRTQIAELWISQDFLDDKVKVKLGKIDVNSEFAAAAFSADFLHSSAGLSPTVVGMPTYPDPATGGEIVASTDHFSAGLGLFDGALAEGITTGDKGPATFFGSPSDLFLIAQAGPKWKIHNLPGEAAAGVWHHTGRFDRFDGRAERGTTGFYLQADQLLFAESDPSADDLQGIGIYLHYGWADPNITVFNHHIGGGVTWTGAIPTRDQDVIGLGVQTVLLSDKDGAGVDHSSETAVELFYKAHIFNWLQIQPDIQYIVNPGGVSENEDSLVATLRLMVTL